MPTAEEIPVAVQELVSERIHSIEELEAVLLLHADPERVWTAREVREALRISEPAAVTALEMLVDNQLASPVDGKFRYARTYHAAVSELAKTYAEKRVETLVMISHYAIDRVRHHALRTFSEAFRLGERKKGG